MNLERFKSLLEAYGADMGRWPEDVRGEARTFADASAEAQRLLAAEAAFDRVLDAAETAPATRALEDRILASFPEREVRRATRGFALFASAPIKWAQAAALAVSLALGLGVGAALPGWAGVGATHEIDPALVALGGIGSDVWNDMGDGS